MATLKAWPDFARALGIDPFAPQAVVAGQFRLLHGPLFALQRCHKVGQKPNHEWIPSGDACLVDHLSDEGGIFWRPACPGGHMDRHYTGSHIVFYEIDDRPLAGQWEALDRLTASTGVEPAAVVFSGSKSLHVYFQLDRALDAEGWKRLMRKLAIAQNSDPAIVSLSRLMRLPGAKRCKNGQWVEQSIERLTDEAVYSPEDFEARLDGLGLWPHGLPDERWRLWRSQRGQYGHNAPALLQPDAVLFPPRVVNLEPTGIGYDGQAIPLERCLSRREREWLNHTIPQGERNANGLVLGRSLVGTHDWLTRNGYRVDGHPESLFWDCLGRSGLGEREINTLWRQSTHGNPRPSLPDEALLACVQSVIRDSLPTADRPIAEWRRVNGEHRAKNPKNPNRPPQADRAKSHGFQRPSLADRAKAITDRLQSPLGKYRPNLVLNVPDLSQGFSPALLPTRGVVVIASPMGTGKTKLIRLILDYLMQFYPGALAPGHRVSLQRGFAERLALDFLNDVDRFRGRQIGADGQPTKRLSLCWDSILAINPADYPPGSYVLILDEADQGFLHFLLQATCGKDGKRPAIVARAIELIKNAGLVILASADITEKDIDFVCSIRNEQPFVLQNTYQRPGALTDFYTGDSKIKGSDRAAKATVLSKIYESLVLGHRIWVSVDTLKLSKEIEKLALKAGVSADKILRFDGETSSEPTQRAFADSPNERAKDYQVVVANSSLTSGVSVEIDHFNVVYGLFTGATIAPWDATQMLARVRQPVPRVVCARQFGKKSALSRGRNPLRVSTDLLDNAVDIAHAIDDEGLVSDTDFSSPAAVYVARAIAETNEAMGDFALQIRLRLEHDGHAVEVNDPAAVVEAFEASRDRRDGLFETAWDIAYSIAPELAKIIKAENAAKIHSARILSPDEFKKLRKKTHLSFDDRCAVERFVLCDFYAIEPKTLAIDDVLWDDRGAMRRAIKRDEALLWAGMALERDQKVVKSLRGWGEKLTAQDLPRNTLQALACEKLGWDDVYARVLSGGQYCPSTPWVLEFADRCLDNPKDCDRAFGFWPNTNQSPAAILGMALRSFGVKTKSRRLGTGDRQRVYQVDGDHLAAKKAALARRAEQHLAQGFQPRPHPLTLELLGGVAAVAERLADWPQSVAPDTQDDGPEMTADEFEAMAGSIAA